MVSKNNIIILLLVVLLSSSLAAQDFNRFILVKSGRYSVGKKDHVLNPLRTVTIDSFYISATETTNAQFEAFVQATGYITDAERLHNAMVFEPGLREFEWKQDSSAYWKYPNGIIRGGIEQKMNHPVTGISYADAMAYCRWAHVRLPSLVEWEIASRAGANTDQFFGSYKTDISKYANIWLGRDHLKADSSDGYLYTSPVASFAPNVWGLYDVYGNVFELCSGKLRSNQKETTVHARGGSWWCSKNSCNFFNSVDIGRVYLHASFSNLGFRVAADSLPQ